MTYRGSQDAGILKREALVGALASEPDLDRREALAIELAGFDRWRRIEARKHLPLIANARIASPCHEPFEAMSGEGAIRSCARCDQEVFDLAQMTLAQAEALVASRQGGSSCVRLHKRRDGTMMFADCEVGAKGVWTRRAGLAIAATVIATTAVAWIASPPVHVRAFDRPPPQPSHAAPDSAQVVQGLMQLAPMPAAQPLTPFSALEPRSLRLPTGS
jgi:hypothetical protein